MMDPLSITASTIALVGFGFKLVQGLNILRDLSHITDDISALLDEINDLQDVLTAVCVATKQRSNVGGLHESSDHLRSLLAKTGEIFASIADHCGIVIGDWHGPYQNDSKDASASSNLDLLSRFRWLKDRKKVERYRQRLKILRLDIGNHLASLSLLDSCSVLVQLRDLNAAFHKLSIDQSSLQASLARATLRITAEPDTEDAEAPFDSYSPTKSGMESERTPSSSSLSSMSNGENNATSLSTCSCSCHRVGRIKSPDIAQAIFGSVALSLSGIPSLSPACDEIACRTSFCSSFMFIYRFPMWLSNRALNSMFYSSRASGPQFSLTFTRIVPRNSDILCFAAQGDVVGIKDLFSKGLASPFDASHNYGYTPLHCATDYGYYELCDFLLKAGAKSDLQDFDGRSSTDIAYHKLCTPNFDESSAERLRSLFNGESWFEQKQLTILHKIVLRLTSTKRLLADELLNSTREINTPDSGGRTPISWAAENNEYDAVATLLRFGADLSKPDNDNNTPLHYACSATASPSILTLLLSAGANPTARNNWHQTPLNWASFFQNEPSFAHQLLACNGVHPDETDRHGTTAINNAAFKAHETMLRYLLEEAGADPNCPDVEGTNSLLDSISGNRHDSFSILLETSRRCKLDLKHRDQAGENCLHYLARRADAHTATIFLDAVRGGVVDVSGLDTAMVGKDELSVRDLLALRGIAEVRDIVLEAVALIEEDLVSSSEESGDFDDKGEEEEEEEEEEAREEVYLDAMEHFLPQLEKDSSFGGVAMPRVQVMELAPITTVAVAVA